jgi:hypothetical protein
MERRKFEDLFKDAFEGAEVSPSDGLWTNIELDLEKADGSKVRRRLLFYKLLAAASVTFAMCLAGLTYYVTQKSDETLEGIAANSTLPSSSAEKTKPESKESSTKETGVPSGIGEKKDRTNAVRDKNIHRVAIPSGRTDVVSDSDINNSEDAKNEYAAETQPLLPASAQQGLLLPAPAFSGLATNEEERALPLLYSPKRPGLTFTKDEPDPGVILLAKLAEEERRYAEEENREKEKKSEKLWTSVGFAAGGFSSVNSSVTPTASNQFLASSNSTVADKQASASGIAYSYGVNIGARLSKRWVLQGGVNYLIQSSDYTANNVVGGSNFQSLKAESINALDNLSQMPQITGSNASVLAPTFPYSVNNNVKFFSVPVQAGYLVVNKKFGVQLNAGVSTDLFLQNTITPEGGSLDKTTQGRGDDSPYRSVNFSGLMGTEFTYRFGQRYRVALNPGFRYPFNSVYKTDVGVESTPLTFDIGLRFRYIFQ